MIPAVPFLAELRQRGVILAADHGTLRWQAPAGVLTDADKALLKQHKAEILAVLAAPHLIQDESAGVQSRDESHARRLVTDAIEAAAAVHKPGSFDAHGFHAFDLALHVAFEAHDLAEVRRACAVYGAALGRRGATV